MTTTAAGPTAARAKVAAAEPPVDCLAPDGQRILRFDRTERWLHAVNAAGVLVLLLTGTTFKVGGIQGLVGHRAVIRQVHVWVGIGLIVPFTVALVGRWGAGLRKDVHRLGRWTGGDWMWLRSRGRAAVDRVGKFNAAQKLNAVFVAGALPVMLMSGAIMQWHNPFPDRWRTGATFVHDVFWFGLLIAIVGHIMKAVSEPEALRAMYRKGWIRLEWARRHRPGWYAEAVKGDAHDADDAGAGFEPTHSHPLP